MPCHNICKKYRAKKPNSPETRYGTGQKRCNRCDIFVIWEGMYCPCCGVMLRTRPRGSEARQQQVELRNVNRF